MGSLLDKYGWTEWLCHTNFSFLIGASPPLQYLEKAYGYGYLGMAVTDYDGVYGLARAHRDLQALRQQGMGKELRLFHGGELHFKQDHDLPLLFQDTLVLIAQSRRGYRNLCRIFSYSHREGKTNAYVPCEDLLKFEVDDLVAIQPMRGLLRRSVVEEQSLLTRLGQLKDHFGGKLYFALGRFLHPSEDAFLARAWSCAKKLDAKVLLSQDAYFHTAAQKDMSDLVQAIRLNLPMEEAVSHMFVNAERSFHSLEGLERRFCGLPFYEEALRNSRELAESCAFELSELRYKYPKEMIPEGFTAQSFLEKVTWQEAEKRFSSPLPGRIAALLEHELELIRKLDFADYFLTVWDIVHWARSRDILCQGRGSAANSAVCFALGVTSVDPSLFDLLFERFVSVERGDPPDIDVDFEHERREEVIQYIYERYGRNKAAMVANVITFRGKGATRAVGKALGIPEVLLEKASEILRKRMFRGSSTTKTMETLRSDLTEEEAPCSELASVPWDLWAEMAERLKGFPRHLGIHSGGFMLSQDPLDGLVAQEPATMEGRSVVQWCKEDIEGLGFFKIDILALGMLTAVRKGFELIEKHHDRALTLASIPADDGPTYAMLQRADTVGTFQVESRAQMSMLPRLRPRSFYDLVIEIAIIRPGPIQGGMIHPFLRRRNGQEPVTFPDERLRPILARTLGVPIFQEQVMRIAMAVGGFSGGEANELRRHMGAWSIKGDLGPWMKKLAIGMRENGIAESFIEQILGQMRGFAEYGFPESHSVSFALIAYASCYLKCHYPAAFFTAILNSQPMGFYSPHALLQAAQRASVPILPVCVNRSDWDHAMERVSAEGRPPVYAIRLGFRLVCGVSESAARKLLDRRRSKGTWLYLAQCLTDIDLYRNDLTALAAADAFHSFGIERRAALWLAEGAPFCPNLEDREDPMDFAEETAIERVEQDFAATTTTVGPHPVAVIREEHWCYPLPVEQLTLACHLEKKRNNETVMIFGMVLVRQAPPTAKGMMFLTLEDESGFINLVFTPQLYEKYHRLVDGQSFLCVLGKLQNIDGVHSILVRQAFEPLVQKAEVIPMDAKVEERHLNKRITEQRLQKARNYM